MLLAKDRLRKVVKLVDFEPLSMLTKRWAESHWPWIFNDNSESSESDYIDDEKRQVLDNEFIAEIDDIIAVLKPCNDLNFFKTIRYFISISKQRRKQ